jgi:hypothetical protein
MDELAAMAGVDPLEFRLKYLEEGRLKNVLRAAAEKFDWQKRRSQKLKSSTSGSRSSRPAKHTSAARFKTQATSGLK